MQRLNAATAVTVAFAGLALGAGASAAELKILSAGAVQPGLNAAAKIFFDRTGDPHGGRKDRRGAAALHEAV